MRVHFTNLGCKLNQAELERLAREFDAAGHRVVGTLEEAQVHVVNTCTVTHLAARTSRKVARQGGRRRPGLRTVLTGCYATDSTLEAAGLAGVDLVVPNDRKERLLAEVHEAFPELLPAAPAQGLGELPATPQGPASRRASSPSSFPAKARSPSTAAASASSPTPAPSTPPALPTDLPYAPLAFGNTRALVKVEDGCNMRCAFCIIPSTRGRQRSRPVDEVVAEVASMAEAGVLEVVVTGVQISHYRDGAARLPDLARALLERTPVRRLRLTSIAPWRFDDALLELWGEAGGRLCRHVHMSLQSGCDATLQRMRRPYTTAAYGELAERVRAAVPGLALTTDVLVGFPGETAAEFADSLAFVEATGFARIHAFPFSARPGTEAAGLPDPVPHEVKRERMAALLEVAERSERRFREAHVGTTAQVLWESRRDGHCHGTTDNYLRVAAPVAGAAAGEDPLKTLSTARLVATTPEGLVAEPLAPN